MENNDAHRSILLKQLTADSHLNWIEACQWLEQNGEAYCIATIVAESGSVPRSSGSKMVISSHAQFDTLGGGNLELQVINRARQLLADKKRSSAIERFSLAADLGQCCGGAVQVLLETMNCQLPKVVIYGAGHVSQALCTVLKQLPCHVTVFDNRPEWIKQVSDLGIHAKLQQQPAETVEMVDEQSLLIIMTHDHGLDFEITKAALERSCFPYVGLIGSQGKKQRFEFRLKEQLSNPELLNQLTCPIGHPDIQGKLPMQVAISISAQLNTLFKQIETQSNTDSSPNERAWKQANAARKSLKEAGHER